MGTKENGLKAEYNYMKTYKYATENLTRSVDEITIRLW